MAPQRNGRLRGMTDGFSPRLDILPAPQLQLWAELGTVPPAFVLYGGTALALHLGHRQSVDFDFFSRRTGTVRPGVQSAERVEGAVFLR